jgi:glycerophosphoryl diester phosphodiesterase
VTPDPTKLVHAGSEAEILAVFDAWHLDGTLEAALAALPPALPPRVAALLPYARVQDKVPLVIGHRGDPTNHVENTLAGIGSAFAQGADAVELDLLLVREDQGEGYVPVAWHDPVPGGLDVPGLYAMLRNFGLEPRVYADDLFRARPTTPPLWRRSLRRASHELRLSELRAHYGYAEVKSWPMFPRRLAAEIPTLPQIGAFVAAGYRDRVLFLDTKLPAGRPDLYRAMADGIANAVAAHGLEPRRILVGNGDDAILGALRSHLGPAYRYTFDAMMVGPFATRADASAHANATKFGTDLGDVGHVFWGSDDELLAIVARDLPLMHAAGQALVVWTINDETLLRKLMGLGGRVGGGIDMVITDRPAAFRDRLRRMGRSR